MKLVLTVDKPFVCGSHFVTNHYVEAAYGGKQGCVKAQVPGSAADKLDFKSLHINEDKATAVVVPAGGPYDEDRITVSLVREFPYWAVDSLHSDVPVGP